MSHLPSWVSELWIYILNLTPFTSILSYIYMSGSGSVFGIRIQKAPDYGSNTDPDPQHWKKMRNCGSDLVNIVKSESNQGLTLAQALKKECFKEIKLSF